MKRKYLDRSWTTKEIGDAGEFSGYLSVFGNVDLHREIVAKGAFENSLRSWNAKGALPPILWQHNSREPIGPWTKMLEDDQGLYCEGKLLLEDVPLAKQARALMVNNVVRGLSIGVDVVQDSLDHKSGIMTLLELDLWEGSIVTFAANQQARVEVVKSMLEDGRLPSLKEFDELLREAGFSRTQAKAVVAVGYAALLREAEGEKRQLDAKAIVDAVFQTTKPLITAQELL